MRGAVTITPIAPRVRAAALHMVRDAGVRLRLRTLAATAMMAVSFAVVAGQLVRLAILGETQATSAMSEPIAQSFARPDIIDRNGRLLASDVEAPSIYADPSRVIDRDEIVEKLRDVLPDINPADLRAALSDRDRRFVWIKRGVSPKVAQAVHDLGLPGLAFRQELRRAYPAGTLAGHVLGHVNVDNKGVSGIERYVDEIVGVEPVHSARLSARAPLRLSLDIGVTHAVETELKAAIARYQAKAAAGVVIDVRTGEVLASSSLPEVDPLRPAERTEKDNIDKVSSGTYELGSIFKTMTVAMVLESRLANLDTVLDVREPLTVGRFTIKDLHPAARPLSVGEIFLHSSNVGAAMLGLSAGPARVREFLGRLDLLSPIRTELGAIAPPQTPRQWERAEVITASYGHGIAVAPLQFASAAAAIVNGGKKITPTFIAQRPGNGAGEVQVISAATSGRMVELMRRNVTSREGTGRRAEALGYRVGGKTGTAEIPGRGGYRERSVISSFLATFPADKPRYVMLVMLFEPSPTAETKNQVTAGVNAAPTSANIIARIAPLLGVMPKLDAAVASFDAQSDATYEAE